jgi:hypothetical protein
LVILANTTSTKYKVIRYGVLKSSFKYLELLKCSVNFFVNGTDKFDRKSNGKIIRRAKWLLMGKASNVTLRNFVLI